MAHIPRSNGVLEIERHCQRGQRVQRHHARYREVLWCNTHARHRALECDGYNVRSFTRLFVDDTNAAVSRRGNGERGYIAVLPRQSRQPLPHRVQLGVVAHVHEVPRRSVLFEIGLLANVCHPLEPHTHQRASNQTITREEQRVSR